MAEAGQDLGRVDIVEAGLDAQIGLLSMDEQTALGERLAGRFGWQTAGDLAVAKSTVFTLDRDDYDLTVTALTDLGVKGDTPEFEEIAEAINNPAATYLGEHTIRGDKPELTMHLPVSRRGFTLKKLIAAFDAKQEYATSVWDELWGSYTVSEHNSNFHNAMPGLMLNDTTDPVDRTKKANGYDEAGLVYANQTVPQQVESVQREQLEASGRGVQITPTTISEYIVAQAKRRQAGLPLLDKPTVTRFVQYPEKNIDGYVCVPSAYVRDDGQLNLDGSRVAGSWGSDGVRRVVRVA